MRRIAIKVEQEINFLKSMPENKAARNKIEKERSAAKAIIRAGKKAYSGPPLLRRKMIGKKN